MGKSSRRKKDRRKATPKSPLGLEFMAVPSPFANVPRDQLIGLLKGAGKEQAQLFTKTTAEVRELMSRVSPIYLLTSLSAYGIPDFIDNDGTLSHGESTQFFPAHLELAQAVALSLDPEALSGEPPQSQDVGLMLEMLPKWADQFHWKRLSQVGQAVTDQEKSRLTFQEQMRFNTQMIRNWGFYGHVKRIATEFLGPLDSRFEIEHGYRLSDLILLFDHMFNESQKRQNEHLDRLALMMRAKTLREAVAAYYESNPALEGSPESFEKLMREGRATLRAAKFMMLSHSDLRLPECYTFASSRVAQAVNRVEESVEAAFHAMSCRWGELKDTNIEHAFMNNPVWTKPLVSIGDGNYFCPLPQTFFAYFFETVLSLLGDNSSLREIYDKRRSDYLERKTAEIFGNAFPGSKLTPNFKWQSPDKSEEFETDLIVDVDSILILVEAKSGRVSPEARRGAPKSLGEDINRLVVEPSRQSKRLQDAIDSAKSGAPEMEAFRNVFPANLERVHRIVRVSVTLEDIGFLHTNVNSMKEAGYVPADIVVAPAVTLADLEIVFDILQSPLERIHYWVQRSVWEGGAGYTADEIDLLAVYLNTGLTVGDIQKDVHFLFLGASKPIDEYYEASRYGITKPKPTYQATQWWRDIVGKLESKKPDRWIEAGIVLLSAGYEQQLEIEKRVKSLISVVERKRERAASRSGLIFVASANTTEAIAFLALLSSQIADRFQHMGTIASEAFSKYENVRRCVIMMINVDDPQYPYGSLGVFTRAHDT